MEIKHTPGPWVLGESSGGRHFRAVNAREHSELATVVWVMEDDDMEGAQSPECEANANLIAAAPELLDALHAIAGGSVQRVSDDLHRAARAAIAKAKGEEQ